MKKTFLFLFLLGAGVSGARAQSLWVSPPGTPVYRLGSNSGLGYAGLDRDAAYFLTSPQANVLWGVCSTNFPGAPRDAEENIFRTVDNGQTWQVQSTSSHIGTFGNPSSGFTTKDLAVVDAQVAFALEEKFDTGTQEIWRTTTGPAGFAPVYGGPRNFKKIHFFSTTTGIACTYRASGAVAWQFYRTTDAGATWSALPAIPDAVATAPDIVSTKYAVGTSLWLNTSQGKLLTTSDAGLTWSVGTVVGKVVFEDALRGLAYAGAQLARTTDGGATWTAVPYTGLQFVTAAALPGMPGAYISSNMDYTTSPYPTPIMAVTLNRGTTWRNLPTDLYVERMAASSPSQLWALRVTLSGGTPMVASYSNLVLSAAKPVARAAALFYPNPTTGPVQLAGSVGAGAEVLVYDAMGRLCQRQRATGASPVLDLSGRAPGLYQVVVLAPDGTAQRQTLTKTP